MHYAAANVLARRNMTREAIESAWEAVGLDPDESRNWGMLASSLAVEKKYKEAALRRRPRPGHFPRRPRLRQCPRLQALSGMGRSKEAAATIDGTLQDPDNAFTHANMGWTLLPPRRPPRSARQPVHFREALRLDPTLDFARGGLVEAMKARYFLYRVMLTYFLFMARLPSRRCSG